MARGMKRLFAAIDRAIAVLDDMLSRVPGVLV